MTKKLLLPTRQQRMHIRLEQSSNTDRMVEPTPSSDVPDIGERPVCPLEDCGTQKNHWPLERDVAAESYSSDSISDHNRHCEATANSTLLKEWINDQQVNSQHPQASQQSENKIQADKVEDARPLSPVAPALPSRRAKVGGLDPHAGHDGGRQALLQQIREVGCRKPVQSASYGVAPDANDDAGLRPHRTISAYFNPAASAHPHTEQAETSRATSTTLQSKSMNRPSTHPRKLQPPPIPPKPRSVLPTAIPSDVSKPQQSATRNNDVPTISSGPTPEIPKILYPTIPLLPKSIPSNVAITAAPFPQSPSLHTPSPNKTPSATPTRIFTSNCGNWSVQAELLDWKAGKVWLRKTNDVKISVPLSRFSGADVEYILAEMMQRAEERVRDVDGVRADSQRIGEAIPG